MKRIYYSRQDIAVYSGRGTLTYEDGLARKCVFKAWQTNSGEVVLLCHGQQWDESLTSGSASDPGHFEGRTYKGGQVRTEQGFSFHPYVTWCGGKQPATSWSAFRLQTLSSVETDASASPHTLKFGLTNLRFFGTERVNGKFGATHSKLPLHLESTDGALDVEVRPLPDYPFLIDELRSTRGVCVTCEVTVPVCGEFDLDHVEQFVSGLCYLLSVARGTKVQWVYCDSYDESGRRVSRRHHNRVTKPCCNLRIISEEQGGGRATQHFVEAGFPIYNELREAYRLDCGTIDLYLDAKAEQDYIEARGAKIAVAMEALNAALLRSSKKPSVGRLIPSADFARILPKISSAVQEVLVNAGVDQAIREDMCDKLNGLYRKSFRRNILLLCRHVGFKPPEEEVKLFVESRNSLIHKGDFYYNTAEPRKRKKCPLSSAVEEYFFLVNFLDRVFLKLFGYSGPYMDWRQPFSPQHSTLE